jgi:hypothetical protein
LLSVPGQDINGTEAYYFYSLAEAYNQYEYPEGSTSVLPIYEKVTLPAVNWISYGDMYARSFLKMAKIYDSEAASRETPSDQAKVNKIKAIENYRKFLSLWGNADSIFAAEVTDAKERLASLESE